MSLLFLEMSFSATLIYCLYSLDLRWVDIDAEIIFTDQGWKPSIIRSDVMTKFSNVTQKRCIR